MLIPTLDTLPKRVLANIDVQRAFIASRLIVAAERLQLFRLLHHRQMTKSAISAKLKIHDSQITPFLQSLVALGLLRNAGGAYSSTRLTEKYFVKERPIQWTRQYSQECVEAYDALALLEERLTTGNPLTALKRLKRPDYVECMKRDRRQAEDFTQMLFHLHQVDAEALARYLDLSAHRAVLDVGGGSGVMSIALARRNPHIRACILDIAPVCQVAAANIRKAGLSRRISTCPGDLREPWPSGYDVVLICDIGQISSQMLSKAFKALPPKGMIVLVDRYLSDDRTRPLDRLLDFFVSSSFPLATGKEMAEALKSVGFDRVKARDVYEDLWFVTGVKPGRTPSRQG